jgi:hypothetical protein
VGRAVHGCRRDAPCGPPLHPRRPRALCCASPISSRAAAPRVLPTLAASGDIPPLSTPPLEKERRGRRRRGGRSWRPFAAKTGAARGRSQTRRHQGRLLPLLQRRHAVVFFLLTDEPCRPSSPTPALRPVATKVRTSFPALYGRPGLRAEGNATLAPRHRAARTAPPRRRRW